MVHVYYYLYNQIFLFVQETISFEESSREAQFEPPSEKGSLIPAHMVYDVSEAQSSGKKGQIKRLSNMAEQRKGKQLR